MSHFFAYLARMKYIQRWGLMRNTRTENLQEHSLQVAMVAHGLALIRNREFGGAVDADRVAVLALFHDAAEVITGDLPTPVKYFNDDIRESYRRIEAEAEQRLLDMLPEAFREDYAAILDSEHWSATERRLVKAADAICGYLKCAEEEHSGNHEFVEARRVLWQKIGGFDEPEVAWFVERYVPSFSLTLDALNAPGAGDQD